VIPEPVLQFVRRHIKSVWTLDLLFMMRRSGSRSWTLDELARELRGNRNLVQDVLSTLSRAGLLAPEARSAFAIRPRRPNSMRSSPSWSGTTPSGPSP
jgi:hypothetical protein